MKLLFVANRVPYPPFRGDKLKIYNLAKKLRDSHEIHLLAIAENKEDLAHKPELEKVFHKVTFFYLPKWKSILNVILGVFGSRPLQVVYFRSSAFRRILRNILQPEKFDGIHVQHLRMSQFIEEHDLEKVILDLPDAFSLYWQRRSENAKHWWMRQFASVEYRRLLNFEKKTLPKFPLNLVCSAEDQAYLMEKTGAVLDVLPNGVDTDLFAVKAGISPVSGRILFTGNMDYEPNVDAVEYFCQEIFPIILDKFPEAEFVISGQRPVPRVLKLASAKVIVTGFVSDISEVYATAQVLVAPLRFGAGTQNKVLEALAMKVPVVCTAVGFKGLGLTNGQGAILASDREEFAREVIDLLSDVTYREKISSEGSDLIRKRFSWSAIALQLEKFFLEIAER